MYERIRNLREDHDLKQEDIARLLHCTQACYSHYETGKREIPTEVLRTLADFYHVSIDYLLGRDIFRGAPAHCTFFRLRNTME